MADYRRPLPAATPETQHFWDGVKKGQLLLQKCQSCAQVYFPPRPFCPSCSGRNVAVFAASGRATLHTYVINHRLPPGFDEPYAIAVVKLEEGPTMMTNIVDCPQTPEALQLDMALEVIFDAVTDEVTLPKFRPLEVHA